MSYCALRSVSPIHVKYLRYLGASGAAVYLDGRLHCVGDTPSAPEVEALMQWLNGINRLLYASDQLSLDYPPAALQASAVGRLDFIAGALGLAGWLIPPLVRKAELARIGRYYATESMLVLDAESGRYDAAATPSTGTESLFDHFAALVHGTQVSERGDHAIF